MFEHMCTDVIRRLPSRHLAVLVSGFFAPSAQVIIVIGLWLVEIPGWSSQGLACCTWEFLRQLRGIRMPENQEECVENALSRTQGTTVANLNVG